MAESDARRITAILLKKNLSALYADVMPLYALSYYWELAESDAHLPDEAEVKEVLKRYNALKVPRIEIESILRAVATAQADYTGSWPTIPPECGGVPPEYIVGGWVIPSAGMSIPQNGIVILSGPEPPGGE